MHTPRITPKTLAQLWEQSHHIPADIAEARAALASFTPSLHAAGRLETPLMIHTLSIPGVGKTTVAERIMQATNGKCFFLAFDRIMEAIPGYTADFVRHGPKAAAERWTIPARVAGYELLDKAMAAQAHILFEHSGCDRHHPPLLLHAKQKGFEVVLVQPVAPLETAIERASKRERFVGEATIRERHQLLHELLPTYRQHFPVIDVPNGGGLHELDISPVLSHLLSTGRHL